MVWLNVRRAKVLENKQENTATSRRGLVLALLVTTTMGCVFVTLVVTLVLDRFWLGLLYIPIVAGLMKLFYEAICKYRPREQDPEHFAIQESVVAGGLLSVLLAYQISHALTPKELFYGGLAMGLLASFSLAWEWLTVAREHRAAGLAKAEAEKGRRAGDDGDFGTAQEMLESALLTTEMAYGSNHPQVATIVTYLADVLAALGQPDPSGLMLQRAVGVYSTEDETPALVEALQRYTDHLRQHGHLSEALTVTNTAVEVSQRLHGEALPTARAYLSLAQLQSDLQDKKSAYQSAQTAVRMLEVQVGRNHHETMLARAAFARSCIALGRAAEGERILTDLLTHRERLVQGQQSYDIHDLGVLLDLADAQRKSDPSRAVFTYGRAVAIFRSAVGPEYGRAAEMLSHLPAHLAEGQSEKLRDLYNAMASGDSYSARLILRESNEVAKLIDSSGWTPLQWACFFGLTDLVPVLLGLGTDPTHGADSDFPALYVAARWGRHRIVASILQHDPEIDINVCCADGSRPLHAATRSGNQLTFEILLSRKASLDLTNYQGWNPLHEAAYLGHRKFVVSLLAEGVDVDSQLAPSLDSPLHAAVRGNSWLSAETLLLNNAAFDLKNSEGKTPLDLAQELYHARVVAVLESAQQSVGTKTS